MVLAAGRWVRAMLTDRPPRWLAGPCKQRIPEGASGGHVFGRQANSTADNGRSSGQARPSRIRFARKEPSARAARLTLSRRQFLLVVLLDNRRAGRGISTDASGPYPRPATLQRACPTSLTNGYLQSKGHRGVSLTGLARGHKKGEIHREMCDVLKHVESLVSGKES
jgi:hypothetical protein